jgi:hypothetical protein
MRGVEWMREMVEVSWLQIHPYFFHIRKWLFPIECSGWYERLQGVYLHRGRGSGSLASGTFWEIKGGCHRLGGEVEG